MVPPPSIDGRRLAEYADSFRSVFARSDQARWFLTYLRGLLDGDPRKNIKAIASRTAADDDANAAQALQHFVTTSPWNADHLLRAWRELLRARTNATERTWIVHDCGMPKKGRHSVGVQRQFVREFGKKLNAQVAVVVSESSPVGWFPLAVRLYLPVSWLRDRNTEAQRVIPEEDCQPRSKIDIALGLLDELLAEDGRPVRIVAEEGYASSGLFHDGVNQRGLSVESHPDSLASARYGQDWLKQHLGLHQFEGRSWRGWHHHVSMVFAAFGFLTLAQD